VHRAGGRRQIGDALAAAGGTLRALLQSNDEIWDITAIAMLPVLAAALAARLRRKALVVTWQEFFGPEWLNYLGPRLGPIAQRLERMALAVSPIAIVTSPQTRNRILAAGFPAERLRYIPNGIATAVIDTVMPHPRASDFITVGRLVPHKRVDLAIRALALLRQEYPTATLAIVGDGPDRAMLEALTRELDLTGAVTFHGFLPTDEEVFAHMKASRVALLPSAREGFGLAAVQAWACGKPVIVCNDAENATAGLVTDPRLGSVVSPAADAIAAAAARWWTEPDQAAYRIAHVKSKYEMEQMMAAVRDVYREAIDRLKPASRNRPSHCCATAIAPPA
jgi:glycosyltransferase involved in cell wall biosynthesis